MKLLATKIVAKSFLGRSRSFEIISKRFELCSKPSSILVLVKEKRATSAPDINAEHKSIKHNNGNPITTEKSIAKNNSLKLEGSGSKNYSVS